MKIEKIWAVLNMGRSLPAWGAFKLSKQKHLIEEDMQRWLRIQGLYETLPPQAFYRLNWLLLYSREFRNVFYNRFKDNFFIPRFLGILYKKNNTLEISTRNIGGGLFISHGNSTIIVAKSIGENCWINQQVTIGYARNSTPPTLCNNVRIGAGAVVIGNITIGNNSTVGAGAVVTKSVPDDCVVVGNPAYIIKRNGIPVKETLSGTEY